MTPQTVLTNAIPLWFWTAAAKHNDPVFLFVMPVGLHETALKLHKSAGSPGTIILREPGKKLHGVKVNGVRPNFGVFIVPSHLNATHPVLLRRDIAEKTFLPAMRLGTSFWLRPYTPTSHLEYETLLACPDE